MAATKLIQRCVILSSPLPLASRTPPTMPPQQASMMTAGAPTRVGSFNSSRSRTATGAVRAAALAARQARQVRERSKQRQQQTSDHLRAASPVSGTPQRIPFHEKKRLQLQLNLDVVKTPDLPLMATRVENEPTAIPPPPELCWEDHHDLETSANTKYAAFRRRQSSVILSIDSPEGAEFGEVAHDGPAELGRHTKKIKKLGRGAGGTVYLALYLPVLKLVAVKEVVVYKEEERSMVKHELHALHENLVPLNNPGTPASSGSLGGFWDEMRHHFARIGQSSPSTCPYVVAFYGAYLLPAKCAISIVMEFMDMGSLQDLLDAKLSIPEPVLRHCAYCCMTALEHMHRHRMIHRDIKPANILMNRKGEFKVADFGLAGTLSKSESFFSEFEGTMMYMAPERIQGQPYTCVSDVWSMGVSLFYLATGTYPFEVSDGFFGLEEAIVHDPLPPMPNRFSVECRDFIKNLLRRDPTTRMDAANALSHPFLRGYSSTREFRAFPGQWSSMPLRRALKKEDVATIAEVVADNAHRHPDMVPEALRDVTSRRYCQRGIEMSAPTPHPIGGRGGWFSRASVETSGQGPNGVNLPELGSLAEDCGVEVSDLLESIRAAGDRM